MGKTHLGAALGVKAIERGFGVVFYRQDASLFFRLVSHRYEKGAILITANKGVCCARLGVA